MSRKEKAGVEGELMTLVKEPLVEHYLALWHRIQLGVVFVGCISGWSSSHGHHCRELNDIRNNIGVVSGSSRSLGGELWKVLEVLAAYFSQQLMSIEHLLKVRDKITEVLTILKCDFIQSQHKKEIAQSGKRSHETPLIFLSFSFL